MNARTLDLEAPLLLSTLRRRASCESCVRRSSDELIRPIKPLSKSVEIVLVDEREMKES
jgi:hypothetical protein